jgi:DNA-binding Xre family transcriptional regulator
MSQTSLFIQTLKQCLKHKNLTYLDVAKNLQLSEASVKRMFSEENISLHRLDKICQLLNIELCDLAKLADQNQNQIQELTEQQEQDFVEQPDLLFMAYMLLNEMCFDDIIKHYAIDFHQGIQLIAHLDRIKFIELLPNNRVKLLTSRNFRWRKNGVVEKLFNQQIRQEFFQSDFNKADESMQFGSALLSQNSLVKIQQKIDKLVTEYNELAKQDAKLPFEQKVGCSLVGAIRPWQFSLFKRFKY